MATSTSNEASEIRRRGRQRLIGAVALVLLLVVFVPMVLDSEPRPSRNEPALNIPPKDNPPPLRPPVETQKPAEPPKPASVTPKLEGFAVQVGAFRDEEKLRQAREKLTAAGIAHYTERLENPAGALTRLRAGPFPTRAAADAAAAKIEQTGFRPHVLPLD